MDQAEKRTLRNNIIKFIIGLILLAFSFGYIQNHPAEKSSIFSGFQVLWQRVVVYVHQVTNTNSEAYQKKIDYEKTYQELVNMVEGKKCTDPSILTDLQETYLKLKKEQLKDLENDLPGYIRKANEYKTRIDHCVME